MIDGVGAGAAAEGRGAEELAADGEEVGTGPAATASVLAGAECCLTLENGCGVGAVM